jgi:hypothetical protein
MDPMPSPQLRLRRALLSAVIALLTPAAFASDVVPVLDVEPSCRAVASRELGSLTTIERCLRQEMSAHSELAQRWSTFEAGDRQQCVSQTSMGGIPSYVELLVCVAIAADARALRKREAFREGTPSTQGMGDR